MDKKEFLKEVSVGGKSYGVYDINRLGEKGIADIDAGFYRRAGGGGPGGHA